MRIDIHLDTSNYDLYWAGLSGQPLQTLGTGLLFRVPAAITRIDRVTIAHFGATVGLDTSSVFYDNFSVALIVSSSCYANCDASTTVPFLNVNDFACFQAAFASGSSYANCDHSTVAPVLNVNDFACFQAAFAAGCSAP